MSKIEELHAAICAGKVKLIENLVAEALDEGNEPLSILNEGMIAAMTAIGEKFQAGEAFVPEMLVSARAMKKGVEALKPRLSAGAAGAKGLVVIGTVAGDLHDIGKNLVAMMIESAGFEVVDLGVDVSAEQFVEAVMERPDAKIVALSTLLTTTMPAMRDTVTALKALDGRGVKLMVGGAPVTEAFASEIGADGYAPDAASAATKAKELIV